MIILKNKIDAHQDSLLSELQTGLPTLIKPEEDGYNIHPFLLNSLGKMGFSCYQIDDPRPIDILWRRVVEEKQGLFVAYNDGEEINNIFLTAGDMIEHCIWDFKDVSFDGDYITYKMGDGYETQAVTYWLDSLHDAVIGEAIKAYLIHKKLQG